MAEPTPLRPMKTLEGNAPAVIICACHIGQRVELESIPTPPRCRSCGYQCSVKDCAGTARPKAERG